MQSANDFGETFWPWAFISCMGLLCVVFATTFLRALKKFSTNMEDCWKQAADED